MLGLPIPGPHRESNPRASVLASEEAITYLRPLTLKSVKTLVPPCPGHAAMPDVSLHAGRRRGISVIENILLQSAVQIVGVR